MRQRVTTDERAELQRRVRSLEIRAEEARLARVILMLADGDSYSAIESAVPCYGDYINRWRRRFLTPLNCDQLSASADADMTASAIRPKITKEDPKTIRAISFRRR